MKLNPRSFIALSVATIIVALPMYVFAVSLTKDARVQAPAVKPYKQAIDFVPITVTSTTKSFINPRCPTTGDFAASYALPSFINSKLIPAADVYQRDFSKVTISQIPAYYTCDVKVTYNIKQAEVDTTLLATKRVWKDPTKTTKQSTAIACPAGVGTAGDKCQIGTGDDLYPTPEAVPDTTACYDEQAVTSAFPKTGLRWAPNGVPDSFQYKSVSGVIIDLPADGSGSLRLVETNTIIGLWDCRWDRSYFRLGSTPLTVEFTYKRQVRIHYYVRHPWDGNWTIVYGHCGGWGSYMDCRYLPEDRWVTSTATVTLTPGMHNVIKLSAPSTNSYDSVAAFRDPNVWSWQACCDTNAAPLAAPTVVLTPFGQ